MPRQLRIEYEGAIYHVMNRGNGGAAIFRDDQDRENFLKTLGETCSKAHWQIHAYCLMNNHFHLVIETPKPTLVAGMKWLLGTYTQRFNKRHQQVGHLFAGRYKSLLVDESDGYYLRTVCDYVHLNPPRAGLIKKEELLQNYPWSSFGFYLMPLQKRPGWLRVDRLFSEHSILKDNSSGRKEFAIFMNQRCFQEEGNEVFYETIRKGWKFGTKDFMERLHDKIQGYTKKENHLSREFNESMEVLGKKLIEQKLSAAKIPLSALEALPCNDPIKIEIARYLRTQTTLPLKWIASELKAGKVGTLAVSLYKKETS